MDSKVIPNAIGTIICDAVNEEVEFKPISENKRSGFIIAEGIIQTGNELNRNRRYYPTNELRIGINSPRTQELVKSGNFKGEAGHPLDKSLDRQAKVDPTLEQVWYTKLWMSGDNVMAHFRGTNNALGQSFNADLRDGQRPSFSLRALGALVNEGGKATVKNLRIITYDRVYFPSHKNAYTTKIVTTESAGSDIATRLYEIDENNYFAVKQSEINAVAESGNIVDMEQSWVTPMTKEQVSQFVMQESGNIKAILNSFDIICESVAVDPVVKNVHMKTLCGDSISVPLETAVRREIIEGINDLY